MRYCSGNTSSSHRDTRDGPEFETFGKVASCRSRTGRRVSILPLDLFAQRPVPLAVNAPNVVLCVRGGSDGGSVNVGGLFLVVREVNTHSARLHYP